MGMFYTLPANAGTRFRDDYGAALTANPYSLSLNAQLPCDPSPARLSHMGD
ncbi:Uncharacterised protein [Pantoea agglomerans]|uniref:Uncharacterized protein n=1 Tax=Enterobacter agglomerans TaxID=549 RepID=A0A379ADX4_ENTAG|nr:Uncharacterised protein [Pantoea agglomerans]